MAEDDYYDSGDRRLLRLGIDPDLPDLIIYMMLRYKVRTVEELFEKLREAPDPFADTSR